jgi:hypothetical protein
MKYYRVTAYTPYCGEEMIDYIATDNEKKLMDFADELTYENAIQWEPCWDRYDEEGYNSEGEFQEAYYDHCGARIEEITEAEYKEETKPVWPFELVRKEEI